MTLMSGIVIKLKCKDLVCKRFLKNMELYGINIKCPVQY